MVPLPDMTLREVIEAHSAGHLSMNEIEEWWKVKETLWMDAGYDEAMEEQSVAVQEQVSRAKAQGKLEGLTEGRRVGYQDGLKVAQQPDPVPERQLSPSGAASSMDMLTAWVLGKQTTGRKQACQWMLTTRNDELIRFWEELRKGEGKVEELAQLMFAELYAQLVGVPLYEAGSASSHDWLDPQRQVLKDQG